MEIPHEPGLRQGLAHSGRSRFLYSALPIRDSVRGLACRLGSAIGVERQRKDEDKDGTSCRAQKAIRMDLSWTLPYRPGGDHFRDYSHSMLRVASKSLCRAS